jgi:hypothetical protein
MIKEMQPRKLTFVVGYIHILTFKDQIKKIIAPYFTYDLEYGIDNEGTLQENVRLVFKKEGFILQFNKEMASLVYEGPIFNVRKNNVHVEMFLDILEKIRKMETFIKIQYQSMFIDFVGFEKPEIYNKLLESNSYIFNPFGKIKEFASIIEYEYEGKQYNLQFGNFNEGDIEKRKLSPLKTTFNQELVGKMGTMAQMQVKEDTPTVSFSKFKTLISDIENSLLKYIKND